MTHRYFLIVVGTWKFEDWHLYRYVRTYAARNPSISSMSWERIL